MRMIDLLNVLPLSCMEIVDFLDEQIVLDDLEAEEFYNLHVVSISPSKSRKKVKVTVNIGIML